MDINITKLELESRHQRLGSMRSRSRLGRCWWSMLLLLLLLLLDVDACHGNIKPDRYYCSFMSHTSLSMHSCSELLVLCWHSSQLSTIVINRRKKEDHKSPWSPRPRGACLMFCVLLPDRSDPILQLVVGLACVRFPAKLWSDGSRRPTGTHSDVTRGKYSTVAMGPKYFALRTAPPPSLLPFRERLVSSVVGM